MVISKDVLECMPYNTSYTDVFWETCSIRQWLNTEFINNAFSQDEIKSIENKKIINSNNTDTGSNGGFDTYDKIFLLSIDEINLYMSGKPYIKSKLSTYASARNDGLSSIADRTACWTLRTPGESNSYISYVNVDGGIETIGAAVEYGSIGIRPAMWINISE